MALGGEIGNTFRSGYRIQIEWSATQDIANNTSTVTARFYLVSLGSGNNIVSSAPKNCVITIDGTNYTHSVNVGLSGNQKKLLATSSKTITHNSDGIRSFSIGGYLDINVTLSGVRWNRVSISSTSFALDTIPRASSISSFPNFTIGNSFTVSVSRASTSFTHTLMLYVGSTKIGEWTGVGTSQAITLTTSQLNTIYGAISTSATVTMRCYTYNGSTPISNYTTRTATATVARATTISTFSSFTIGNSVSVSLSRALTAFTHTLMLYVGSTKVCERTGVGTSATLSLSTAENNILYNAFKNSTSGTVTLRCYTYHGSNSIRGYTSRTVTASVASSIVPSFTSVTASETVLAVAALGMYIQGLSRIKFTINGAQGASYSTISSYRIVFNGATYNSQTATTGAINKSGTLTATATITDSRGRTASKTVNVTLVAYNPPKLTSVTIIRCNENGEQNLLGTHIKITSTGSVSPLGDNNEMMYKIRTRPRGESSWLTKRNDYIALPNLGEVDIFKDYEITRSYDVSVELIDKFNTTIYNTVASTGEVVMSWGKKGIGVGKVWEKGSLDVAGDIYANNIHVTPTSIFVEGDANTYYPVEIHPVERFAYHKYSISRRFNATAPSTWNTATHKGGLTFDFEWSGDTGWGGNHQAIRIVEFGETYTTMVAGLVLTVSGLIVWLRGGGAVYNITSTAKVKVSATIHLGDYISGDNKVWSPRTNTNNVESEINAKWPIRGSSRVYDSGTRVSVEGHAHPWGDISEKPSTFKPSSHNHAASNITSGTIAIARIPTGTSSSTVSLGNHSHSYLPKSDVRTGSLTATSSSSKSVSFASAMRAVPMIVAQYAKTGGNVSSDWGSIKIHSLTKSGFSCIIGGSGDSTARAIRYIAITL